MIFVTGDTHRLKDVKKLNNENFKMQSRLTREDFLIVAGDFGAIWSGGEKDKEVIDFYENKNFTTLFIAGNHENHPLLNSYPVEIWNGGKIHRISEHVIHLMDGQVFEIDGKTIFTMGGATSVDKAYRTEGETWWPEEEPSLEVKEEGLSNLAKYDNTVDYIITHTCPEFIKEEFGKQFEKFINYESAVEQYLEIIMDTVKYKKWYLGHLHVDKTVRQFNLEILYNNIERLL